MWWESGKIRMRKKKVPAKVYYYVIISFGFLRTRSVSRMFGVYLYIKYIYFYILLYSCVLGSLWCRTPRSFLCTRNKPVFTFPKKSLIISKETNALFKRRVTNVGEFCFSLVNYIIMHACRRFKSVIFRPILDYVSKYVQ